MFFPFFFLSVRIFVNDKNVDDVIKKSFDTPVFCVFFSPNCPPCRMMHPEWLKFMKKYAFDPNIIVSECESYTNHVAARKMLSFSSFPTYGLIIKGKGIILNVERNYDGFKAKAEEIKRINIHSKCNYFNSTIDSNNFPAIVLESNEGEIIECSFLYQLSKISGVPLNHFYLSSFKSFQWIFPPQTRKEIKIYYTNQRSQKYTGKRKMKEIASFIKDQINNPPLYNWNLNFPHKSQRKNVIIVYDNIKSIEIFYDFIYERSDKFSFSKIQFSSLNKSFHQLSQSDLPAMIFPDLKNSTCSILKNIDTMMNLRVSFDNNRFGKSEFPFAKFHQIKSFGMLFLIPIFFVFIIIVIILRKSKPAKEE